MQNINKYDIDDVLNILKTLTNSKDYSKIYSILINFNKSKKGRLFEEYITYLYNGNGYIAVRKGGTNDGGADIILYNSKNPNKIIYVIQAKNLNKPLGTNEISAELCKFENRASIKYDCKNFMIISINGYVSNKGTFAQLNIALEDFDWIKRLIDSCSNDKDNAGILPDLKPHNRYSYKESKLLLQNNNRVAIPNATGTGKSFITIQFLYDYIEKTSLVVAPSNEILYQLISTAPWCTRKCSFYTYSKLVSMFKKNELSNLKCDLIILDEMHRIGALKWGKAINYILENNQNAKVIGLSATPIRFLDNNRDMIQEVFDNNSTTPITLTDAIVRRILPNPIYVSAIYKLNKEIDKKISLMNELHIPDESKNKFLSELNKLNEIWSKENGIKNIIKTHLDTNDKNMKFIVFCEDIVHLKKMQSEVLSWFNDIYGTSTKVKIYEITSHQHRNEQELYNFENNNINGQVKLLFCINKLNEGIHLKTLTGIIMLRNTKSPVIYYQQIGRCLTTDLVDTNPIIFDFVDNIDNLELINFRHELYFSEIKYNNIRGDLGLPISKTEIYTYDEYSDVINRLKNIEKRITYNWDEYYTELIEFKNLTGHCNVTNTEKYSKLHKWVSLQRRLYEKKLLSEERINKLNQISFPWDLKFQNWQENLYEYKNIVENLSSSDITYFEIFSPCYCLPVYSCKSLSNTNPKIYRWFTKELNSYKSNNMSKDKSKLFKTLFIKAYELQNGEWIKSLLKIKEFFNDLENHLKIPISKLAKSISSDKSLIDTTLVQSILFHYVDTYYSVKPFSKVVAKTIYNSHLPISIFNLKIYPNNSDDNIWYICFIYFCIKTSQLNVNIDRYIDDINSKYFYEILDNYTYLIDFWVYSSLKEDALNAEKQRLLNSITINRSDYDAFWFKNLSDFLQEIKANIQPKYDDYIGLSSGILNWVRTQRCSNLPIEKYNILKYMNFKFNICTDRFKSSVKLLHIFAVTGTTPPSIYSLWSKEKLSPPFSIDTFIKLLEMYKDVDSNINLRKQFLDDIGFDFNNTDYNSPKKFFKKEIDSMKIFRKLHITEIDSHLYQNDLF